MRFDVHLLAVLPSWGTQKALGMMSKSCTNEKCAYSTLKCGI
jgi:hypothetical protein